MTVLESASIRAAAILDAHPGVAAMFPKVILLACILAACVDKQRRDWLHRELDWYIGRHIRRGIYNIVFITWLAGIGLYCFIRDRLRRSPNERNRRNRLSS